MCSSIITEENQQNSDNAGGGRNLGGAAARARLNGNDAFIGANNNVVRRGNNNRNRNRTSDNNINLTEMDPDRNSSSSTRIKNLISRRRRTIYVFYFMAFLDLMAVSSFLPLMSLTIRNFGATPFMTGLIGSVYGAIQLVSSPVVGWGSDIYGQKLILFACLVLSSCSYIIQGFSYNLTFMLVARAIAGIFKHTQTVGKSIVSEISSSDKSYVIGNFNAFGSMGFIVGPTVGAHLAQMDNGFQLISFFCAAAFLINSVLVILLVPNPATLKIEPPEDSPPSSPETSQQNDIKGTSASSNVKNTSNSTSYLKSADLHVFLLLIVRFLFSFATLTFRENLTIVLQDKYNSDLVNTGYLTSLQALVSTVLSFCVGPINQFVYKGNSFYMVVCAGVMKCIVLFTLFYSTTYWVAASGLVAISALNPFLRVGVTALSLEGHQNEIGIVLGLSQSANSLARMIAPTGAGIAIGFSDDGPFMLGAISACFGVVAILIAKRYTKKSRRAAAKHAKTE